jgi:hypothetical protein
MKLQNPEPDYQPEQILSLADLGVTILTAAEVDLSSLN